ncbi:hypothetical protein GW915_12160 [bacterium]|nr:hypothetical protein [bacterium]
MNDTLVEEFLSRIEQAHKLGEWKIIEHWSKQWIQSPAKGAESFRWLGRASLALHKLERAAYAFNRILDYDVNDREAIEFFQDYPSTAPDHKINQAENTGLVSPDDPRTSLSPKQRLELAETEESLAKRYFDFGLYAESAQRYEQSFFWKASEQAALGLAKSLHRCGESHKAQKFLREKIYQNGEWIRGQLLLGNILFEMGQLRAAQTEWQNVLKADPNNGEALRLLRGYHSGMMG